MYEKGNNYDEGDILRISGNVREFSTTTIESQYDFTDYLKTYCVKNRVYASKVEVIIDNPFSTKDFSSRYLDQYNDDAKFVISSINFGSKNYDSDLMNEYKDLSVISLLANSGMFFSFVIEAFTLIFVLKLSDNKAKAVSLALCFPYLLFNLFSFGLFKVFLVKTLQLIFKNNKKFEHFGHLEILSIACTILLIFDPTAITRLEFALSFILSFIYVILMNDLRRDDQSFKTKFITNFKIKVIIFMFFIPINLSMNNSVNIFTLFSQIIFIPVYKVCYFVSFISFFIGYNPILDGLYFVTNRCVTLVSDYTPSIYAPEFNPWLTLVFYLIFFIFILLLEKKLYILNKKIAFLSIFGLLIYFLPIKNLFTAEVVFINVGQGDSILIRDRFTTCLIDTGGLKYLDVADDCLIPFLKSKRIYNIDTLFISHDDYDHSGAYESLVKNFHVDVTIRTKDKFPYKIGGLTFENLNVWNSKDANENSLVLYLEIYNNKFLFTGDASKEIEEKIIQKYPNLQIDYLKVGHHGSNTSTSEKFIASIKPKEAIISCGVDNSYKHPHDETLKILKKYNVKIRRTDKEGTIVYNL